MSGTLSMEHIQLGMSRGPAIEDASLLGSFMTLTHLEVKEEIIEVNEIVKRENTAKREKRTYV